MSTGNNKNLDELINKVNSESGVKEILRLRATKQLKNEHKKAYQMADFEKTVLP